MSHLFIVGRTFESIWSDGLHDSLVRLFAQAWKLREPGIVLVAHYNWGVALRQKLASCGESFVGVRFNTLDTIRQQLLRSEFPDHTIAEQAHLRFLFSMAARERFPAERAVKNDPAGFLKEYLELKEAGFDAGELFAQRGLSKLLEKYVRHRCELSLHEPSELLSELCAMERKPRFSFVAMLGFTSGHFKEFRLLRTLAASSRSSVLVSPEPVSTWDEWDMVWQNMWEEVYGDVHYASAGQTGRYVRHSDAIIQRTSEKESGGKIVGRLVAAGKEALPDLITSKVTGYLADGEVSRLGVIVSPKGALGREVALRLSALQVPFFDGVGFPESRFIGVDESDWLSLIDLLRQGSIQSLLSWARRSELFCAALNLKDIRSLARLLQAQMLESATDHLVRINVRRSVVSQAFDAFLHAFRGFWEARQNGELHDSFRQLLKLLKWKEREQFFQEFESLLQHFRNADADREAFLSWVEEVSLSHTRKKTQGGKQPFAKVWLSTLEDAQMQEWSHLIIADIGQESHQDVSIWMDDSVREKWNSEILKEGAAGEGSRVCKPDCFPLFSERDRRAGLYKSFVRLVENVQSELCLAWAAYEKGQDSCRVNLRSEAVQLLAHDDGSYPSYENVDQWIRETSAWHEKVRHEGCESSPEQADVQATSRAWTDRRDENKPFGAYECVLNIERAEPWVVSVRDLEASFSSPLEWFIRRALGALPVDDSRAWRYSGLRVGNLVHSWISQSVRQLNEQCPGWPGSSTPGALREELRESSQAYLQGRDSVLLRLEGARAYWIAGRIARVLEEVDWGHEALSEYEVRQTIPGDCPLEVSGRLDLVGMDSVSKESGKGKRVWIFDIKTGGARSSVTHASLVRGEGFQLLLYAMAMLQEGVEEVQALYLTVDATADQKPHLATAACRKLYGQFAPVLVRIQQKGCFGLHPNMNNEYGYGRAQPLATLRVPREVLERKHRLSNPEMEPNA